MAMKYLVMCKDIGYDDAEYYTDSLTDALKVFDQYKSHYKTGIRLYDSFDLGDDEPIEWNLRDAYDKDDAAGNSRTLWFRVGMDIRLNKDHYDSLDELQDEIKERLSSLKLPDGMTISGEAYSPAECIDEADPNTMGDVIRLAREDDISEIIMIDL